MAQVIRNSRQGRWIARWRDPSGHQRKNLFSPNTVQLACSDAVAGRVLRLGPGCVVSAFDVPFGHLAFDDARYRALASGGIEPTD